MPIEAYRSNVMFKSDILNFIFRAAPWSSGQNAGEKSSRILQNFWVCSSSRQFIFKCFEL